jgi:hypothetical protein
MATRKPSAQADWSYHLIMQVHSVAGLAALGCATVRLEQALDASSHELLRNVTWPASIHLTSNFVKDVKPLRCRADVRDSYRRSVDVAIVFPGQVVLVSEREANGLLPTFWEHNEHSASSVFLVNFAYLRDAALDEQPRLILPRCSSATPRLLHDEIDTILVSLQLFMAETNYTTPERQQALREFLHHSVTGSRKDLADVLVAARGTSHTYARSHLASVLIEAPWDLTPS